MRTALSRGALSSPGCVLLAVLLVQPGATRGAESSALSDEVVPLQVEKAPRRPQPLELGPPFLGTGVIGQGFEIPGGAVWRPQLLVWGTLRSAVQSFDRGEKGVPRFSEWRNRLDIFGQLAVTKTERVVAGFRPLDDRRRFTGCGWKPDATDGCDGEFDDEIFVLFGEVNLGETFPDLDLQDRWNLDIELAGGKQQLFFQEGFLVNDQVTSVAITRNNISLPGTTNTRLTGLVGLSDINRNDNRNDSDATLGGIFIETDVPFSTINFDFVYVSSDATRGSAVYGGLSFVQRIGHLNTAFRVLFSENVDGQSAAASDGVLLFSEIDWVPPGTHDNLYLTLAVGIDEFSSVARAPDVGGPLGQVGLLFSSVGLGNYGAPLPNNVQNLVAGALGYQMFFARNRRWLTFEVGGRANWEGVARSGVAGAMSYRHAIGRRWIARLDGFLGHLENGDLGWGARTELLLRF